jgi:hypothetical protein
MVVMDLYNILYDLIVTRESVLDLSRSCHWASAPYHSKKGIVQPRLSCVDLLRARDNPYFELGSVTPCVMVLLIFL